MTGPEYDLLGKSVLVTGGSGFIGRHLCLKLMACGARVTSVDLNPFPLPLFSHEDGTPDAIQGDICYLPLLDHAIDSAEPDIVFHLAGMSQVGECFDDPLGAATNNIMGTAGVLELLRGTGVKLVVSTSDKVYGQRDPEEGLLETGRAFQFGYGERDAFRPRHPYEASKGAADLLCQAYAHSYRSHLAVLRLGNVYGPHDLNLERLIPSVLMALCEGRRPALRTANLDASREYLYIDDALDAFLRTAMRLYDDWPLFFNVSAGNQLSIAEVLSHIYTLGPSRWADLQFEKMPKTDGAKAEAQFLKLNSLPFREATNWTPKTSFTDGITKTIEWYREYADVLDREI